MSRQSSQLSDFSLASQMQCVFTTMLVITMCTQTTCRHKEPVRVRLPVCARKLFEIEDRFKFQVCTVLHVVKRTSNAPTARHHCLQPAPQPPRHHPHAHTSTRIKDTSSYDTPATTPPHQPGPTTPDQQSRAEQSNRSNLSDVLLVVVSIFGHASTD
jgi:hypothetical protein